MKPTAHRSLPLGTSKIIATVEDGVGWITFNHPERRNAMSLQMWQGLADAAEAFRDDAAVRVVVMRGAGGKAFVSGADISEFEAHRADAGQKLSYDQTASRGTLGLARLDQPLIAMVDGFCIGGGLALALSADVRFASRRSTFGIPAARLGLGYDYRGIAALARIVGPSAAKDMLFSARHLGAEEALRLGLINFVVDADALDEQVRAYATQVAANAPLTVRAAKAAVRAFERYADDEDSAELAALVDGCFDSADYKEGRTAFLEKRSPRFGGR